MVRKLHRAIGLIMLLPLVGWAATGAVFFTKPGYGAAYDARLYKIHYLQWTGEKTVDKFLGLAGLVLLVTLGGLGVRLAFRRG